MRNQLRLALRFDPDLLRRDLQGLDGLEWVDHFVKQNYEGTWSVLPLRAPVGAVHPIKMIYSDPSCDTFVDTPLLERCPYVQEVLAAFACPLHAVRLMKLTPGSTVKPHTDHDLAPEYGKVRIHIPITTNPEVDFQLNGERVRMGEGECWYLRLTDTHTVANHGATDRVHLVIDALVTPWLAEQLANAERAANEAGGTETSDLELSGWVPFRVRVDQSPPIVDWCLLGDETFSDPFFEQTIGYCLRKRFNHLLPRTTPIDALIAWGASHRGIAPTAFIFHGSRCGSTLLAQMAAALPQTIVISEAAPIDQTLRARAPVDTRLDWLRALLSALGQPRRGDERHLFVKFDAWHVFDLPLVQQAFPGVPCVFLYREPSAVLASQMRMPGIQTLPGMLAPSLIGSDFESVLRLDREEYCARVIGAVYAAALTHAAAARLTLMNYSQLPEAAVSQVLEWCGRTSSDDDRARLHRTAAFDAKTPSLPYDRAMSGRAVPSRCVIEAARFVDQHYERLEAMRLADAAVSSRA